MAARVVFLDRDGTLNVDQGYVGDVSQWTFVSGAVDALKQLRSAGFLIAVVSNQSGIGRKLFTREQVERLHEEVQQMLLAEGASVDLFAYCPHLPSDHCRCRKPGTLLAEEVARRLGVSIDYGASWTVGDKPSDIAFGMALGTHTALLTSKYWRPGDLTAQPTIVADSLLEAAKTMTS